MLDLIERFAQVIVEQIGLGSDQIVLGDGGIARKLIHLQYQLQVLPSLSPLVVNLVFGQTQLNTFVLDL
ncbi:hypothetical protein BpHYR1_020409 [Brachionus plicatilis]|uniref:Uncharacterized protein n=1 Tax=Brachionus plicatilis TaxID=10195 RepID=A0A3M7R6D6_BRAPC|nr:hypothetical protein BpHYR1_020409 [Brachionus plicatilis]